MYFFFKCLPTVPQKLPVLSVLQREPDREEQPDSNMPPKFKRHLNDDEVTGSIRSERVRNRQRERDVSASGLLFKIIVTSLI